MKTDVMAGCVAVILIFLSLLFKLLFIPFLLMVCLGAVGVHLSYLICVAFWILITVLLRKLRPRK